jgi:sugar lactone lactonase YvrE
MRRTLVLVVTAATTLALTVPTADAGRSRARDAIVFNGQANDLDAYSTRRPFEHQTVITNRNADPKGLDINAQICFFGDGRTFIAGEDTGQPEIVQGWGIFRLSGSKVGKLRARQIGKLQPTYQGASDNAENYGCGVLADGRVVTTDIGNQASGPENGQLIIWFPPLDEGFTTTPDGHRGTVPYCKLDVAIGTAGGIAVDDEDRVYLTSARGSTAGVWRYPGPFPTGPDAEGGCTGQDGTGAPLAEDVEKTLFIATSSSNGLATPNAIVAKPGGGWYVSSVINGIINEYDENGEFVRTVLQPPAGATLGPEPFETGTPLGLGVGPDGSLYYADIGIVVTPTSVGPGDGTGKVRKIRFVRGEPQPPQTLGEGLEFPDGIGVFVPPR